MCCLFASMALIGPRFAILIWWLFDASRWEAAFSSFWMTLIGFLFAPWTTLSYVLVWSPNNGLRGFDWIILGLGILADISTYTSGQYGRTTRQATV